MPLESRVVTAIVAAVVLCVVPAAPCPTACCQTSFADICGVSPRASRRVLMPVHMRTSQSDVTCVQQSLPAVGKPISLSSRIKLRPLLLCPPAGSRPPPPAQAPALKWLHATHQREMPRTHPLLLPLARRSEMPVPCNRHIIKLTKTGDAFCQPHGKITPRLKHLRLKVLGEPCKFKDLPQENMVAEAGSGSLPVASCILGSCFGQVE